MAILNWVLCVALSQCPQADAALTMSTGCEYACDASASAQQDEGKKDKKKKKQGSGSRLDAVVLVGADEFAIAGKTLDCGKCKDKQQDQDHDEEE